MSLDYISKVIRSCQTREQVEACMNWVWTCYLKEPDLTIQCKEMLHYLNYRELNTSLGIDDYA